MPDAALTRDDDEDFESYVERGLRHLNRRLTEMESSIAGPLADLAADETTLAGVVGPIVDAYQAKSDALAALEAKIASGELVDPAAIKAEVATIKSGLDADIAKLQSIEPTPAPVPPAPGTATNTLYLYDHTSGAAEDARFTDSAQRGEAGEMLLVFSGDTAPGETNGASVPGYTVYSGTPHAA